MVLNIINENLILPVSDRIQGLNISENLKFLNKSQFWSREELLKYQESKFKDLIKHIYINVPFYSELFYRENLTPDDFKELGDIRKLPVLSKAEIRKSPEKFISRNTDLKKAIRQYSSGSTGEPFEFFLSPNAFSMKYAAALRGWSWMGYRLGDHYAKLSQNKRTSKTKKLQDLINRSTYLFIPDLSRKCLENIIALLEKKKPLYVRCYPDPLVFMSEILRDSNKKFQGIKAINTTGNILTPESRALIEERFNCPVFDSYSCEGGALFYESPERDAYLGSMEYALTEVLDSNFNEVNSGISGYHVTTDLHNYAMPLIRYNTQDLVEKSVPGSTGGRELFRLSRISGRDNDVLVTPSGNYLIVHLFTIYFEYFTSVSQFQIEQTCPDEFIFRLIVDKTYSSETEKQIFSHWQKELGENVKLKIEIHDELPLLFSGKRRFLIRNPEIKLTL